MDSTLFSDNFANYLQYKELLGHRASTLESNHLTYKTHIQAELGKIDINNIDRPTLFLFFMRMKNRNISVVTIHNVSKLLKSFFNYLIKVNLIQYNPCNKIELPNIIKPKYKIPSQQKIQYVLEEMRRRNIDIFPHTYTLSSTGVRHGELHGFCIDDVDFVDSTIEVNKSYRNGVTSAPKTEHSYRKILCTSNHMAVLEEQKYYQNKNELKFLFARKDSRLPYTHAGFSQKIKKVFCDMGLDTYTVHSFRHAHATYLIESGRLSLKAIQERLGWSDANLLLKTYSHITEKQRMDLLNYLENMY